MKAVISAWSSSVTELVNFFEILSIRSANAKKYFVFDEHMPETLPKY
jgi:hypothetical protein